MTHTSTGTTVAPPLRLAVVIGSSRQGRYAPVVAEWFLKRADARPDLLVTSIDVGALDLPHTFGAPAPGGTDTRAALADADAFVIVTPEYNHSYPAALKNLIDAHGREWQAKPVGFVSYGGMSGGLRAVEHLRGVFAELHAVTVRDTVSFHNPWRSEGAPGGSAAGGEADSAATTLLDQLVWWGEALRAARAVRPYGR
ncbi:NAD(P)H-dependent oxidoreductase [Nocardia higoensis]|uniref:NAD(P)H-dependent oxidoreductase n=1 Tax=Nocardia higoensis TaxID=228599 RepID=A0ABS0DG51_9NOCA|nr:NAD(P)H-dependent oxidoreductase [Nocardia higoensis]MBF6357457.1 NAD(P)H-dependent oxidoreductase [Nocardia higoensis]